MIDVSSKPASTPIYLVWNGELMIDATPATIWPHILNYPEWQKFSITERVEGVPNSEGEVVLLKKIEAGFDFPPYHARTIKLDPEKRIIWKTYPEREDDRSFFGIVEFTLAPTGPATRFNYNILYEFLLSDATVEEADAFRNSQRQSSQDVFDAIFPRLKALSEADEGR